jgi:hypothetical protein
MNELLHPYVLELVRIGYYCTVAGSDLDSAMRALAQHGFAKKAWFRNYYTPTEKAKFLAPMLEIEQLMDQSFRPYVKP